MIALILCLSAAHALDRQAVLQHRLSVIERAQDIEKEGRTPGVIETLIGGEVETSLARMEERNLLSGRVARQPWSGDYWANASGGLGARYADPDFPMHDWRAGENYVLQNSWRTIRPDYLSPAEKYDLVTALAPTEPGSLTRHQWNKGRAEYERTGTVATWQGICHGWAPASIYFPEPKREVTLKHAGGETLFTIDDIKALGSLYWANGNSRTLYAGRRCNARDPRANREGRVLSSECFDVNPADWHLAAVNLIGIRQESFLIDATASSEVWNHPVVSYQLEFFDPNNSEQRSPRFRDVMRERSRVTLHRDFRSQAAVYIVGVTAQVEINVETSPGESENQNSELTFVYDLELDRNFKVVGGEWREAGPDFIWRPRPGVRPTTPGDSALLQLAQLGDAQWRASAKLSSRTGAPLRLLVEELVRQAAEN